jgi:poly(A) polymerase
MKEPPSLAGAAWLADPALQKILRVLTDAGGEGRVAGGAVRDALFGEPIADIDIATTLKPERVMEAGAAAGLGVHPTGLRHGTITLTVDKKPFEVTTLRLDVETDGRRAKVQYTDDWSADAHRRDFTVNALFCDGSGKIYDFTDGYRDILRKRIRFVGRPAARIKEDYLRILRFFRFHARYGKGAPDAEGLAACARHRKGIDGLSAERVRQELMKLLVAPRAAPALQAMRDAKILPLVLPGAKDLAAFKRMAAVDPKEGFAPDAALRLAAIVDDPLALKERLRLTNHETRRFAAMMSAMAPSPALRDAERRAVLYALGVGGWKDSVRVAWARSRGSGWRALHDFADAHPPKAFPVGGQDLIAAGFAPGPEIGKMLARLEDWWIASDFEPAKDELMRRIKS